MVTVYILDSSRQVVRKYPHVEKISYAFDGQLVDIPPGEFLSFTYLLGLNYYLKSRTGSYSVSGSIIGTFEVVEE